MWPENVGIHAIEIIFPSQYVDQNDLETYDKVSSGKYRVGLGQEKMGFCNDREDINSLCLTVVKKLMERYDIDPRNVGRLEVGTETIVDKSKSCKTVLMQLFESYTTDIDGIDTTNACYGGTSALFNAINWIESSSWDGRYAIVVAADIAVYAKGSARPTGGAGAVAMLIAPNAPLVLDRIRSTHMKHAYDFYKPDLSSEYPTVDGKLSIQCYLSALDHCYGLYVKKCAKNGVKIDLDAFDAVLFHTPYCKLVQKSLARLALNDYVNDRQNPKYSALKNLENVTLDGSYFDRDVEKTFMDFSRQLFVDKTQKSLLIASQVGNMYTPSLYGGLVSLLMTKTTEQLIGKRIALFSYGSGLASSLFALKVNGTASKQLTRLIDHLNDVHALLGQRKRVEPQEFSDTLELRERVCHQAPYKPIGDVSHFFPGTYYLTEIDEMHRRKYDRTPNLVNGTTSEKL